MTGPALQKFNLFVYFLLGGGVLATGAVAEGSSHGGIDLSGARFGPDAGIYASTIGAGWGRFPYDATVSFATLTRDLGFSAPGPTRPRLKFETSSSLTADDIVQRETKVSLVREIQMKGLKSYGAEMNQIQASAGWIHFGQFRQSGSLEFQPADGITLATAFGAGGLTLYQLRNRGYGNAAALPLWKVRGTFGSFVRVEGNGDFLCLGWSDTWDAGRMVTVNNALAEVETLPLARWQLKTTVRWSFFGDGNQQKAFESLALRDVLVFPLVVKAGAGGGWMGYRSTRDGYWSSLSFASYGLRLIASKVIGAGWSVESKINYGFHRENENAPEREVATELHLQFRDRSGWLADLGANVIVVNGGAWWRDDVGFRVEIPL